MRLPKTIYAKREADGKETYLVAYLTPEELAGELNKEILVGMYKLKRQIKVKLSAIVEPARRETGRGK